VSISLNFLFTYISTNFDIWHWWLCSLVSVSFCVQLDVVQDFLNMRRSAAPSQKGPAPTKKAFFVPPFLSKKTNNDSTAVSCVIIFWFRSTIQKGHYFAKLTLTLSLTLTLFLTLCLIVVAVQIGGPTPIHYCALKLVFMLLCHFWLSFTALFLWGLLLSYVMFVNFSSLTLREGAAQLQVVIPGT